MSERELRNFLTTMDRVMPVDETVAEVRDAVLADTPDVVGMLLAIKKLESAPGCSCPLTLAYLRENAEKTFHVRLKDAPPGYEWTD